MHIHPMANQMPIQHVVETHQTQAAKQAEARRKISQFLIEESEEEQQRSGREQKERPRQQREPEEDEFAHIFSATV